ncbi:MAG TPA: glycosyltransferase family 39 protein [Candidatus Acidoferrum sp.]|nr:glycosyltransferase family 39 protein [Candidatus Acidoferrum sp.]
MRRAATSLALILLVALGVRAGFAWSQIRKIPQRALAIAPFEQEAGNIAYALAEGKGFSNVFRQETGPTAWLAPVYPLLVAAAFKIFGVFTANAFFACVGLNILFSSATCVPIFYAGKRIWRLGAGAGGAWLWAIFPNAILIPFEWVWDTSLSALLGALLLWTTLLVVESKRTRDWCGYGLLWGMALLTNPALGALLPFLLVWAAVRGDEQGAWRSKRARLALAMTALCCVPWTMRNYVAFHRFIPLRSNFAFELWLGNNDIFDPTATNGRMTITRAEEASRYAELGETAYMAEKWTLAISFIETHPQLELELTGRKFVAFWTGTESPLKVFFRSHSIFIQWILFVNVLTAAGGLLGIFILWRKRTGYAFPAAIFPVIYPCVYYLTHADLRYRHTIDPVVCLLAAIVLARMAETRPTPPHAKTG